MFIDLNNRKTTMLFMIGAKATIMGTSNINACLEFVWTVTRLYPVKTSAVVVCIRRNQRFANTVGSAPLLVIDVLALDYDLGWHRRETLVAERCGLPVKEIGRGFAFNKNFSS